MFFTFEPQWFPTLFAKNAKRMGRGAFVAELLLRSFVAGLEDKNFLNPRSIVLR